VSTDERCLARLAADGWSLRPASGLEPASIATAFAPAGSRAIAPTATRRVSAVPLERVASSGTTVCKKINC